MNTKVNFYFNKDGRWREEINKLRAIILGCGLDEKLKWGVPCYVFRNRNIVLMHVFKDYCALLFFKGALLNDTHGILVQQTKNVQSARQVRFTSIHEIIELGQVLKEYINEAIEAEKAGLKVKYKKTDEFLIPEELQNKLDKIARLKNAFKVLTPGRQRAYLLYFSSAKHSRTREQRVEKYIPKILSGKGLND